MEIPRFATDLQSGIEVINRSGIDPYADIRKIESYTSAGNLTGYGVEIDHPEDGWKLAGTVSQNYLLIPNREVRDVAEAVLAASPFDFEEKRVFFDGKRFMSFYAAQNVVEEVSPGDEIGLGVMFRNSYDGSTAFEASICAIRLICSNGMISRQMFSRYRFKHAMQNIDWERGAEDALSIVKVAPQSLAAFGGAMRRLSERHMTDSRFREIRTEVIPNLPAVTWGRVVDQYVNKEESSAFGLLNAVTATLWHNPAQTVNDLQHNEYAVSRFVSYGNNN
jgi:hypothetical protein